MCGREETWDLELLGVETMEAHEAENQNVKDLFILWGVGGVALGKHGPATRIFQRSNQSVFTFVCICVCTVYIYIYIYAYHI